MRARAAEALLFFGDAQDLVVEVEDLLNDPYSWVRSRSALALGRKAAGLPVGSVRVGLAKRLRQLEWDVKWDVDVAAGIALLRMGEKNRQEQRDLLDEMACGSSDLGGSLYLELFDALAHLHEPETRRILHEEIRLSRELEGSPGAALFFKERGLRLEIREEAPFAGRLLPESSTSGWRLLTGAMSAEGLVVRGSVVQPCDRGDALSQWRKRLE